MLPALTKSIEQLWDPKIRRVLIIAILTAFAVFAALFIATLSYFTDVALPDWGWLDWWDMRDWLEGFVISALIPLALLVTTWFLFAPIATAVMSIFLDDVADAVEAKHYPGRPSTRRVTFLEALLEGLRFALVVIGINLLALPLYLILLITFVGMPAVILLWFAINSYLYGREYFELAANRHMAPHQTKVLRRQNRGAVMSGGLVITGMFLIPFASLLAPIIGAAVMVHVFHETAEGMPEEDRRA